MPPDVSHARPLIPKLERALRHHRRHVFDEASGRFHERAIRRLKATAAFRCLCQDNENAARARQDAQLARMGY